MSVTRLKPSRLRGYDGSNVTTLGGKLWINGCPVLMSGESSNSGDSQYLSDLNQRLVNSGQNLQNQIIALQNRTIPSIQSVSTILDFGLFSFDVTTQISGLSGITSNSQIVPSFGTPHADHPDAIEPLIEELSLSISDIIPNTGFTLNGYCPRGSNGKYNINFLIYN